MSHPTTIPQEILDEIITHLADDLPTLHTCSTTTHSLHHAARRHIFYTIRLYTASAAHKFHALLTQNPDIAPLVRTLHVYASPCDKPSPLPCVLPHLRYVTHLVVGCAHGNGRGSMNWQALPPPVKRVLETLVASPHLRTLEFTSVLYLPISILSLAAHAKVLKLYSVAFTELDTPDVLQRAAGAQPTPTPASTSTSISTSKVTPIPAPKPIDLESIHCSSSMSSLACPPLHAPHLRHYTIVGNSLSNLLTVQEICSAAAPTCAIDDLTWLDYRGDDQHVKPALLTCPRRLAFTTWTFNATWRSRLPRMWASIAALLGTASLAALEELSVTLRCAADPDMNMYLGMPTASHRVSLPEGGEGVTTDAGTRTGAAPACETCLGAPDACWTRLDALLGDPACAPKLRAVRFVLEVVGGAGTTSGISTGRTGVVAGEAMRDGAGEQRVGDDAALGLLVGERLPMVRGRGAGVLSVGV